MSFKSAAPHAARLLLGLVFFVFGLNGFLHFIPVPPPPGEGGQLMAAMQQSGYLFGFVKGTEVLVGALLLSNRWVPLALVILAPVMLNIVAFHAFLEPAKTLALPLVLLGAHLLLAWNHRAAYAALFSGTAASPRRERPRGELAGAV